MTNSQTIVIGNTVYQLPITDIHQCIDVGDFFYGDVNSSDAVNAYVCKINDDCDIMKKANKESRMVNWFDMIDRVIYTLKDYAPTKDGDNSKVVLTTVVYFADCTRSIVKNALGDKIGLIYHDDGTVTPDEDAKRLGLMYAITKRMFGTVDDNGNIMSNGYMYKLTKIANAGIDSNQASIRHAREKAEAKARHKKMLEEAKARKAKANEAKQKELFCWDSFCETYPTLNELLLKLADKMTTKPTDE